MTFLQNLGLSHPIFQAPMAGVSTPALAAAVSNAGALGAIGVGATNAVGAAAMIQDLRKATGAAFNVNVFVHQDPEPNAQIAKTWCDAMAPLFATFNSTPPQDLHVIYKSFAEDDALFRLFLDMAPPVVSFHFGLPEQEKIDALHAAGCVLLASVTNMTEAKAAEARGIDAIVAQGFEAGGHRGVFDPDARDEQLSTHNLTRLLATHFDLPIIAAGGIMDGAGIRAVLNLGATAAQLGTAFVSCPESAADAWYRSALMAAGESGTLMTRAISGRPARCLNNHFTDWGRQATAEIPSYPIAYDAGKALNAAAKAVGENGYGAQWAGQGAPLARSLSAANLVATLARELKAAP